MHAISSYRGNRPTNKQTHPSTHTHKQTRPITIHHTAANAPCNDVLMLQTGASKFPQHVWYLSASYVSSLMTPSPTLLFTVTDRLMHGVIQLLACCLHTSCMSAKSYSGYPSMFPLPNRVQYLPFFVYFPENFLIINCIKPADLFHSSPYPHFKGF